MFLTLAACGQAKTEDPPAKQPDTVQPEPIPGDDELADRYLKAKELVLGGLIAGEPFAAVERDLELIANHAKDPHLRANAGLLLGSAYEQSGDRQKAIAFYRHASKLVPDDAGPHMALALVLAADGQHAAAAQVQERAAELDKDNLENWLALGEMRMRAGLEDKAAEAYAAYEIRRKGLIDGLTLKKDGVFVKPPPERAACALALAAASDDGTALALLYALQQDSESSVRAAVARTMGVQRLRGYRKALEKHIGSEQDADVREALQWALDEIERDPVDTRPPPGKPSEAKSTGSGPSTD